MESSNISAKLRDPSMFGIRYMAPKGRLSGYLVKLERNRKLHQKWFGQAAYGSLESALAAAKAWRDEMAPKLPGMTKQEFVSIVRPNNRSGIPGVMRITRRKKRKDGSDWVGSYWMARAPRTLRMPAKYFSIAQYGEMAAKELAAAARQAFVVMCDGYHLVKTPSALLPRIPQDTPSVLA